MNSLNTLYFPGTNIHSIRQFPLFLLLRKLHLLQPVEGNPDEKTTESTDNFIKNGFCQVHTPCPLGENRKRFQHLVHDIANRKDDYTAQLSSLTLASMSHPDDQNGLSEREIITAITTPPDKVEKKAQKNKESKLWQARLVLAIGELLDKNEEEITGHLANLENDEKILFKELHGEDVLLDEENPFAESGSMQGKLRTTHSGSLKNRFNSWKTLFVESDQKKCELLLTTMPESGDFLLEEYENFSGSTASLILTINLPAVIGGDRQKACDTALAFHVENTTLLTSIESELDHIIHSENTTAVNARTMSALSKLAQSWDETIDADFPADQYGRLAVRMYVFPGVTCSALLSKDFKLANKRDNGIVIIAG